MTITGSNPVLTAINKNNMSDSIYEIAHSNADKLGRCLGVMNFLIHHGELTNFDWKQVARTYVAVNSENTYSQDDITWIREEAVRRGVDIGE
jgi:hypothetical protein